MYKFCVAMVKMFGAEHSREPNAIDTTRLLALGATRGFFWMVVSISCIQWGRKMFICFATIVVQS
jgi:hypothetical protein